MIKPLSRQLAILLALFCGGGALTAHADTLPVIPEPAELKVGEGVFNLKQNTVVVAPAALERQVGCLTKLLSPATSCRRASQRQEDGGIVLEVNPQLGELGTEGYRLRVTPKEILIQAAQPAGIFYGIQTLRQLLPVEIDSPKTVANVTWSVPCVEIRDLPRFAWRGFMLDSCRHFQSVAKVKQVIDLMARSKMNVLHWHLTEDEAWRVEVPGYPELTAKGAWRAETNNPHYGGFYTAKDIREVVSYAAERFVLVYPEVDIPGHATAAILAYPQYSCDGQPVIPGEPGEGGFRSFTANGRRAFCPSRPETYAFLEDVTLKVSGMFDTPYVHIGGDEVPQDAWTNCSRCQALIQREHLKDCAGLQQKFEQRMAADLIAQGKHPIYWGVDLDRGVPPGMIVQGWHPGESLAAIRMGFRTINSNCHETYLNRLAGPGDCGAGGNLPIEKVYAFDPIPGGATPEEGKLILGSEASLWTEMVTEEQVTEKMFPRLFAFAEVVWSPRRTRDIADLRARIRPQLARFDLMGISYYTQSPIASPTAKLTPKMPTPNPENSKPVYGNLNKIEAGGGQYKISIDTSETPDMSKWAAETLAPVLCEWYPRIVSTLNSQGFKAPKRVNIVFRKNMEGVAETSGTKIVCSAEWFRSNLGGEAPGGIIHEVVHVTQHYGWISSRRTPLWLTEGIADYIRWYQYEPQSQGCTIDKNRISQVHYNDSYRVTANFLDWVIRKYDRDLIQKLNAANRNGKYSEGLWKQYTGYTASELEREWKSDIAKSH